MVCRRHLKMNRIDPAPRESFLLAVRVPLGAKVSRSSSFNFAYRYVYGHQF